MDTETLIGKIRNIQWGGGDEAEFLVVRRVDAGWLWSFPIWDNDMEFILETAHETTTTPLELEIAERWPGPVRTVEVEGLTLAESMGFLSPLLVGWYTAGEGLGINGTWVEWDGNQLVLE